MAAKSSNDLASVVSRWALKHLREGVEEGDYLLVKAMVEAPALARAPQAAALLADVAAHRRVAVRVAAREEQSVRPRLARVPRERSGGAGAGDVHAAGVGKGDGVRVGRGVDEDAELLAVAADVAVVLHALRATQLHQIIQRNELVPPTTGTGEARPPAATPSGARGALQGSRGER